MSLSEHEKQMLREIEQSLLADDPKFGSNVSEESPLGGGGAFTLRGVALVVVGLCMLIGGVALSQQSLWFAALSVLGFLVMFAAGVWMLRGHSDKEAVKVGAGTRGGRRHDAKSGGMGNRLEENFRRRFEER
ncbi:DUF3040 domain-containing protein [Corynebacterium sp.]|uniref:DUF3040 domain-containing protein n=1 Tax=Corynebacterium sp. TaxID=1720 RepID=UPI0026DCD8B0|nr:DUF3040 domain-containing protein [Corynebacterium sp.]MDO5031380.1 DUF3040 domain-containing protein [Corynebacterium sp.]